MNSRVQTREFSNPTENGKMLSSVRVTLFFDSLPRWNLCTSNPSYSLREFLCYKAIGVVFECLDNGVFGISRKFASRMRSLGVSSSLLGGCEVAKLTL